MVKKVVLVVLMVMLELVLVPELVTGQGRSHRMINVKRSDLWKMKLKLLWIPSRPSWMVLKRL